MYSDVACIPSVASVIATTPRQTAILSLHGMKSAIISAPYSPTPRKQCVRRRDLKDPFLVIELNGQRVQHHVDLMGWLWKLTRAYSETSFGRPTWGNHHKAPTSKRTTNDIVSCGTLVTMEERRPSTFVSVEKALFAAETNVPALLMILCRCEAATCTTFDGGLDFGMGV